MRWNDIIEAASRFGLRDLRELIRAQADLEVYGNCALKVVEGGHVECIPIADIYTARKGYEPQERREPDPLPSKISGFKTVMDCGYSPGEVRFVSFKDRLFASTAHGIYCRNEETGHFEPVPFVIAGGDLEKP